MVRTYIYNFFHPKRKKEIPLLYSNIKLRYPWCRKFTLELLLREHRFVYGSVVYINEASLMADSKMYKDEEINEILMQFNKLFGHETKGGLLLYDTQSLHDNHHSTVRCLGEYIYLSGKRKVPFGIFLEYRRMKLVSGENSIDVNVFNGEETERPSVFVPFFVWWIFDAFCYSNLTDNLPISNVKYKKGRSLKCEELVTLNSKRRRLLNKSETMENKDKKGGEIDNVELQKILNL